MIFFIKIMVSVELKISFNLSSTEVSSTVKYSHRGRHKDSQWHNPLSSEGTQRSVWWERVWHRDDLKPLPPTWCCLFLFPLKDNNNNQKKVVFIICVSTRSRMKQNFSLKKSKLTPLFTLCNGWTSSLASSLHLLCIRLHRFVWTWEAFIKHLPSIAVNFNLPTSRGTSKYDTYRKHRRKPPDSQRTQLHVISYTWWPALFHLWAHDLTSKPWGHCL